MADIFLSYAREDLPRARQVARALESIGWDVWWDRELRPGVNFREEIERQLNEAACVLVLWSKASIASSFVKDDGTLYTLPLRSNQIQIGRVDE